jgi:hypothetical protein
VRLAPQLSAITTLPQFLPNRVQKATLVSGLHSVPEPASILPPQASIGTTAANPLPNTALNERATLLFDMHMPFAENRAAQRAKRYMGKSCRSRGRDERKLGTIVKKRRVWIVRDPGIAAARLRVHARTRQWISAAGRSFRLPSTVAVDATRLFASRAACGDSFAGSRPGSSSSTRTDGR